MKTRKIFISANYGWHGGDRNGIIEIPEEQKDNIEDYVYDWVMSNNISYTWEDITGDNDENLD